MSGNKIEPLSTLGLYGDKNVFLDTWKEGYLEVSFVSGPWVGNLRLVGGILFYHPDGRLKLHATWKQDDGTTYIRGSSTEIKTIEEMEKTSVEMLLGITFPTALEPLVQAYEETV